MRKKGRRGRGDAKEGVAAARSMTTEEGVRGGGQGWTDGSDEINGFTSMHRGWVCLLEEWMISQSRWDRTGICTRGGWMDGGMDGGVLFVVVVVVFGDGDSGRTAEVYAGRWLVEVGPISENPGGLNLFAAGTCTPFKDFDSHRAYPAACKNRCIRQSALSHNAAPCTARSCALSIFAFATLCAGPARCVQWVRRSAATCPPTVQPCRSICDQPSRQTHTEKASDTHSWLLGAPRD